jgi:tol-pal system protein YbgF
VAAALKAAALTMSVRCWGPSSAAPQSHFGRRDGQLSGIIKPAKMPGMIRPVVLLSIALMCALGINGAHAQDSDSDLETRVDRMQETIRNLTGQVEELQYHNQQLEQQVQRLQQQFQGGAPAAGSPPPYPPPANAPPPRYSPPPAAQYAPPQQYSSQQQYSPPQYSPPPAATGAPADDGHHDAFNPATDPNAIGAPRALGTSTTATEPPPPYEAPQGGTAPQQPGTPLDLSGSASPGANAGPPGQLPPPPPSDPSSTGGAQASLSPTVPPDMTPKDEFDLGRGYFQRKDYPLAVNTFRTFLQRYSGDRLTPEAQYWLGESLFASQQYHDAAEAFLTVSTKYGTNARAPDALLRLGESLSALGQKEAACASLGEVLRKYPRASLSVKESVAREQKRAHC